MALIVDMGYLIGLLHDKKKYLAFYSDKNHVNNQSLIMKGKWEILTPVSPKQMRQFFFQIRLTVATF